MLYKENQDLKAEMQNLKNYYDREKLISHNRKAMRNFPSRPHKRKIRYQRSYESSGNEKTDHEEKYYVYSKKKKPRKKNITMKLMAIMMTLMTILMIMRMARNFEKMIMTIMIMMKNAIKIKITKK